MMREFKKPAASILDAVDRDYLKENCLTSVVDAKRKGDLLKDCPHNRFCDIAEVLVAPVDLGEGRKGVMTIDSRMLEQFSLDRDEMFALAKKHVCDRAVVREMDEVLGVLPVEGDAKMQVVTNADNWMGAAVLGCPEFLLDLQKKFGEEVFIIPSSVHELIILKKTEFDDDARALTALIREVNRMLVKEDALSDSLYGINDDGTVYIAG